MQTLKYTHFHRNVQAEIKRNFKNIPKNTQAESQFRTSLFCFVSSINKGKRNVKLKPNLARVVCEPHNLETKSHQTNYALSWVSWSRPH